MHNFSVNLPSIPSGTLQFKIQNAKAKGFNTKQVRFKQNFHYLVSHFVNSFPNLSPPKPKQKQYEEENKSSITTNLSRSSKKDNQNFRWIVGENKKNLMLKYQEEYKDYLPELPKDSKYGKGFSFSKSSPKDALDSALMGYPSQSIEKPANKITDNYYFTQTVESDEQGSDDDKGQLEKRRAEKLAKKRRVKRSAVFQSEDRWQNLERQMKSKIEPGPGYYLTEHVSEQPRKPKVQAKQKPQRSVNINKILSILDNPQSECLVKPQPSTSNNKKQSLLDRIVQRRSSMFAVGNTDRFGQQIYPVNPKLNVPGPGAYKYADSLEDHANRILVVEEQRRLLKQWYND